MSVGLQNLEHIVVLVLENRSFAPTVFCRVYFFWVLLSTLVVGHYACVRLGGFAGLKLPLTVSA
jgi:hypothetical protein